MQDSLREMIGKINALSLRERVLIFVAIVVLLQQVWDSVVWLPLSQQREALSSDIVNTEQQLQQIDGEIKIYSAKLKQDPDRKIRTALASLEQKLENVNDQTREATSRLVSPAQMVRLLEQLMISEPTLKIVHLRTLDAEPLIPVPEDKKQKKDIDRYQVYRHVFEVEFDGDYLATLRYLEALEQLPWNFFWDEVSYEVTEYPQSRIVLRLYTLSLSAGFVGVG